MGLGKFVKKMTKPLSKVTNVLSGGSFFSGSGFDFAGGITPGNLVDMLNGKTAIDYQNQLERENWNMQNEYNKPSAQMERFKEAGLNPNLIYTQSNTAGPIGSVSAPNTPTLGDAASIVSKVFAMRQAAAQIKNLNQQNSNLQSQDTLLGQQTAYTAEQARRLQLENDWIEDTGVPPFASIIDKTLGGLYKHSKDFGKFMWRNWNKIPRGNVQWDSPRKG